jgi:glutamate-ammonia-ligase adenylyltransferase
MTSRHPARPGSATKKAVGRKPPARARKPTAERRSPDPTSLLLASGLSSEQVTGLLSPYGFADLKRADENIQAMAGEPRSRKLLARILGELLEAVAQTADPDQALNYWERFLGTGINRGQLFEYLHGSLRMLHLLCTIFGNSPSMAQTLIRDPLLVYWLAETHALTRRPTKSSMEQALRTMLANVKALELKLDALRRFRRREMLRIGIRDLLRLADVPETTAVLSDLAAVLIQAAYEIVVAELRRRYGRPMHRGAGDRWIETGFAVVAMGKLGGGELNFSSDVDLIYVYGSDEGQTAGRGGPDRPTSISNEEYFEYLARDLTKALTDVTHEGYMFRVDLRLRAEGTVGRLARPLASYVQYYGTRGQTWERLALLKAWPVAGDLALGHTFLRAVRSFALGLKGSPGGGEAKTVLEQVRAVKEMIDDRMASRGHERRNVKLGTGGIRELEFVVQAIQVLSGNRLPGIVHRSTVGSLSRFRLHGLLSGAEHDRLARAYLFLRDVEHKLQMVHDLQTHALPEAPEELTRCAVRLGYAGRDRQAAMKRFAGDYRRHTGLVNRTFRSLFYGPGRSPLLKAALSKTKRPGGK